MNAWVLVRQWSGSCLYRAGGHDPKRGAGTQGQGDVRPALEVVAAPGRRGGSPWGVKEAPGVKEARLVNGACAVDAFTRQALSPSRFTTGRGDPRVPINVFRTALIDVHADASPG